MPQVSSIVLANAVLTAHVGVILFNVVGMIAIPIGGWCGWRWVRVPWLRVVHLSALALVALQALMGRACFLTLWQAELLGAGASRAPLVVRWVGRIIFWPLPMWVFTVLYVAVFLYVIALWWLVPPVWREGRRDVRSPLAAREERVGSSETLPF
jgi:hypothetical protein